MTEVQLAQWNNTGAIVALPGPRPIIALRFGRGAMEQEEENEQTLNYDFNYNLVLGKSLMAKLNLPQERQLATEWLQKLSTCEADLEELRLRNMFAYFLILSMMDGLLRPPFDAEPPSAPLASLQHLLPGEAYRNGDAPDEPSAAADQEGGHDGRGRDPAQDQRPYEYSPDGGEFFAAQPVPRCGAFCYLAVVARQDVGQDQ